MPSFSFTPNPGRYPGAPSPGCGTIEGMTVRCVSRDAQIAMHSGYDLPVKHSEDLRLLQVGT